MHEKNIDFWAQVFRWVQLNLPLLSGVMLATLIAFVREWRESKSTWQSLAEAVICGAITVSAIRALQWLLVYLNYSDAWSSLAEFCGAMIGFLGTKKLSWVIDSILIAIQKRYRNKE
ncbi:phage holin family protein [Providencia stuartii]|uniref:phage holin family protein n=1 Tax=Providencia stuartii TaxID=588 RepID=UPI0013D7E602|nr:phage holin family protein [Providencia stuartii]